MDNFIQKDIHNPKLKFWGVSVTMWNISLQCSRDYSSMSFFSNSLNALLANRAWSI